MIVHNHRIVYEFGETIVLRPLYDIHLGNKHCDKAAFIKDLKNADERTFFFGGGDMLDSIITSDVKRYRKSSDASEVDEIIDAGVDEMSEILLPYRDRIIGLASGNHEDNIVKRCGTNPVKRICKNLDAKFLGYSGLIKLSLSEHDGRGRTVVVRYHHGWGGGSRTQGADLTKFSRDVAYWDADIFCYGHVHRLQQDSIPRLGLSGTTLISKPKILAICGTYLKTYSKDENPTYSEISGYPPVEIGGLNINIKPNSRWVKATVTV